MDLSFDAVLLSGPHMQVTSYSMDLVLCIQVLHLQLLEAVVVANVGLIVFHGPWVVHVSFTSAAFEALLVANAGNIVFHGPREDVVEFFESCGLFCPERKGVPDFLQEVTSKNDQKVSLLLHSAKPGHGKTVFSSLSVSKVPRAVGRFGSTPGSCDVHRISPVSRSRQDADAGMPASAPASTLCSLGIPASKRRKSSAQRPALRCRARTSADCEQRLSSASTVPTACPQFSV